FLSNVASIVLLNYLVPWVSNRFSWWLNPTATGLGRINLGGWALLWVLCILMVFVFTWLF
ncbi:MAG: antibiotic biosynthesis monooxygenase, partial [Dongiales bacterium]